MNTTPDNMPTELLQASTVEAIDELLRRGVGLDEPCHQTCVSGLDELRALVGEDAVDRWVAR
ncbi:hypothetical protein [Mycobacterium sp.]|jgi:hypothetical protein|uniref:hypothetical protein n=1 Tax=Mycobacterium sp. TaxID=1785 RepID=UPI00284983CE|nr:hypothetical protein [Mycobacterium sp.]